MSNLRPRHQYDCGHCRFAWNCGPLCVCWPGAELPSAPPERAREVALMQAAWRIGRGLDDKEDRNLIGQSLIGLRRSSDPA